MKTNRMFLAILAFALLHNVAMAQTDAAEATRRANEHLFAALIDGDAMRIADSYTEDGWLLPPGAKAVQGREAIRAFWQAGIDASTTLRVDTERLEFARNGALAYDAGNYVLEYRLPGEETVQVDEGKYVIVWKQGADGAWRLHVDMWNAGGAQEP